MNLPTKIVKWTLLSIFAAFLTIPFITFGHLLFSGEIGKAFASLFGVAIIVLVFMALPLWGWYEIFCKARRIGFWMLCSSLFMGMYSAVTIFTSEKFQEYEESGKAIIASNLWPSLLMTALVGGIVFLIMRFDGTPSSWSMFQRFDKKPIRWIELILSLLFPIGVLISYILASSTPLQP